MEVKIGVTDSPRELVFSSSQTPAEVEELVTSAFSGNGPDVLSLTDDKGRRFFWSRPARSRTSRSVSPTCAGSGSGSPPADLPARSR